MAKISILIPVYNGLPYIHKCISSVFEQSFIDWELLISDNCSTDGTIEYLRNLNDERVKIYFQEKNIGIFGNLNFLFQQTKCEYTQILCADDFFLEQSSLQTILNYWENASTNIGFVRFNYNSLKSKGLYRAQKEIVKGIISPREALLLFYTFGNIPGNLSNVSLRSKIVSECGMFNDKLPYTGDYDFWVKASRFYSFEIMDKDVVFVRRHPNVASNYLNTKGEMYLQKYKILNTITSNLSHNKGALYKLVGTINHETADRDASLRMIFLNLDFRCYNTFIISRKEGLFFFKGSLISWFIYFISLGGRLFRPIIANYFVKIAFKKNKYLPL